MKKLAIVIGSKTGHTAKVAHRLAEILRRCYQDVEVFNVLDASTSLPESLEQFDRFLVGAPIYCGEYPELFLDWMSSHRDELDSKGFAFFSIGLIDEALHPTGRLFHMLRLVPSHVATFHGTVSHRKWGWLQSVVLRYYSRNLGLLFARDRDYELTNWAMVDAFAESLAGAECGSGGSVKRPDRQQAA